MHYSWFGWVNNQSISNAAGSYAISIYYNIFTITSSTYSIRNQSMICCISFRGHFVVVAISFFPFFVCIVFVDCLSMSPFFIFIFYFGFIFSSYSLPCISIVPFAHFGFQFLESFRMQENHFKFGKSALLAHLLHYSFSLCCCRPISRVNDKLNNSVAIEQLMFVNELHTRCACCMNIHLW